VYARTVKDQELNFHVSGMLWKRSLVMRDVETGSLWSHLLGKSMRGKLKGAELEVLDGVMTTWGEWKGRHPETTVLGMSRTARRFDEQVWSKPGRFVYGVHLGAGTPSPAVALKKLQAERVVNVEAAGKRIVVTCSKSGSPAQAFESAIEGTVLKFRQGPENMMVDEATGSSWSLTKGLCAEGKMKGKKLTRHPGTISFRAAWKRFFPEGKIIE
jgi:hypothetical protein